MIFARYFYLQTLTISLYATGEVYTGHQTRTQSRVLTHVICLAQCSTACLASTSHMLLLRMWLNAQGSSHNGLCVPKIVILTLCAVWHTTLLYGHSDSIQHFVTSQLHSNPFLSTTFNITNADFLF